MAVLRCKMCGGELTFEPDSTVCECEFCGSKQTIPNVDDEKKIKLFDRANRLRLNCEFDKAASVYEGIISDFPEEAEGYWGNLLCKYGIEYVDDPATGEKIPTCHRSSFDSIMDDEDFEMIMENADSAARGVYRQQAKQIEEIRKGILEVSGREEPYDIFICYKETDELGDRTIDSVLAQDVYDALTAKGYRVFFSRITLEDKLGTEYEPYIFAALNSAKVMLAFGTSYDYYEAVWVKNEWSRYLKLMAKDKSKHLIPCYKDIDAYDIPKEFRALQAQDLGKVGAVQDLLRGIDKLMGRSEEKKAEPQAPQTIVQQVVTGGTNIDALLKRGTMSLEDKAFDEAKDYFNRVLDSDAENAEAYLGLFMAEISADNQSTARAKFIAGAYTDNRYWKRAKQYADNTLKNKLTAWENEQHARVLRDAEAARRAQEEAERKAREEQEAKFRRMKEEIAEAERRRKAAEDAEEKKKQEINSLKEQMRTGKFELTTAEKKKMEQLAEEKKTAEETISSKEAQIATLGIFKLKEKKELQAEIERMRKQADSAAKRIDELTMEKRKAALIHIWRFDASNGIINFGSYEQGNGIKPIEWIVLEHSKEGILVISKYALECRKYHSEETAVTWEKCDLRKWLNHDFLNIAFSEYERSMILDTRCMARQLDLKIRVNPSYNSNVGNSTTDKVFLLDLSEVQKYFKSDESRKAVSTAYAKRKGASTSAEWKTATGEACCGWWLRSPGYFSGHHAASVFANGSIYEGGFKVIQNGQCVRPAMWINLGK